MRKNKLTKTTKQKEEFTVRLTMLCAMYGVVLQASTYCDEAFIKVVDENGNWNILEMNEVTGSAVIQDKDFWEE